jgi:hypothetical protein
MSTLKRKKGKKKSGYMHLNEECNECSAIMDLARKQYPEAREIAIDCDVYVEYMELESDEAYAARCKKHEEKERKEFERLKEKFEK